MAIDKEARKETAREAKDLLTNQAFLKAVLACRKRWEDQLIVGAKKRREVDELVYKIRALEEIPGQLASFVRDHEEAMKRGN